MKKEVVINGVRYEAEEGASLKDFLDKYGFDFPCMGQGRCGKCRVECKDLAITDRDRIFLSQNALDEGWRLACDKTVTGDLNIRVPVYEHINSRNKIDSCDIALTIGIKEIVTSIVSGEVVDTIVEKNPLYNKDGLSGIIKEYEKDSWKSTNALRSALNKSCIELFERYEKATSGMTVIATSGLFAKILEHLPLYDDVDDYNALIDDFMFRLPTELVYFLPIKDECLGGDIFAETVNFADNTLVLDCEEIFVVAYIGKEKTTATHMWDMTYDEIGLKAVKAAIRTIVPDGYTPMVKLYGKKASAVESVLLDLGLNYEKRKKSMSNVARAISNIGFRMNAEKERKRTDILNVLNVEKFHDYFAEE